MLVRIWGSVVGTIRGFTSMLLGIRQYRDDIDFARSHFGIICTLCSNGLRAHRGVHVHVDVVPRVSAGRLVIGI